MKHIDLSLGELSRTSVTKMLGVPVLLEVCYTITFTVLGEFQSSSLQGVAVVKGEGVI